MRVRANTDLNYLQSDTKKGRAQARPFGLLWGSRVRESFPETAAPTIAAARAALATGDVAATEQLCMALVKTAPGNACAWALLAETALLRDRPDAALVCAHRAVALAPSDAIARIMQAKTLFSVGEIAEALEACEAAAPLAAADPEALDSLAALCGLLGRHRQALDLSRRAVAACPGEAQFLFNLAATERMLGLLTEAETHCDQAIACDQNYALAYYVRSDLRIQSADRNHIAEIERRLARGDLDWRAETMLRYAAGKECEDIDAHDRAFAHVAAGARAWRAHLDYDAAAHLAEIDRIIRTQDGGWLASLAGSRVAAAPIFVCGLPRTGTTLVERIVASHSATDSVGETGVFAIEAARALRERKSSGAPDFNAIGNRYIRAVEGVFAPAQARFVDKTLKHYLYCGLIHAALPNAKIILMERGPMDTAWALYKAHFSDGFLFSYDLAELADYYAAYRRLVEHWKRTLPAHAVLTVKYEDVVGNLREQSSRIIEFLGLPWQESTQRFHESRAPSATASAVQIRRPIYATSIGKWRVHAEALAPFRDRLSKSAPSFEFE
jgi:tetratricopeptide (TPR) repeat protein